MSRGRVLQAEIARLGLETVRKRRVEIRVVREKPVWRHELVAVARDNDFRLWVPVGAHAVELFAQPVAGRVHFFLVLFRQQQILTEELGRNNKKRNQT